MPVREKDFKSSTAYKLVAFVQNNFPSAKKLSSDNKTLRSSAILSARVSQVEPKLKSYQELGNIQGDVNSVISTLQTIPAKKNDAAAFAQLRDQMAEKVKAISVAGQTLLDEFSRVKKSVFAMIGTVIDSVASFTSREQQNDKSGSQEIKSQIDAGKKSVDGISNQAEKIEKNSNLAEHELLSLYANSWKHVPTAQQKDLSPPSQTPQGPRAH